MRYVGPALSLVVVAGLGYWFLVVGSNSPQAPAPADLYSTAPAGQQNAQTQPITNPTNAPVQSGQLPQAMQATLHTSKGDIVIEFYPDAPNTVANFTKLASEGFYTNTKFHRVIAGFMIQGGDPLTKDDTMAARWGTGGPGYQFADEIHANNRNVAGTIAMANAGPNTNGSQFFINTADNNFLDTKHTVFGKVVGGAEAVRALEQTPVGAGDRPAQPMVITGITLK